MVIAVVVEIFILAISLAQCLTIRMGGGVVRGDSIPKLLTMTEGMNRGLIVSNKANICSLIDSIESQNADFFARDGILEEKINGKWELLWTTEKETLFFVQSGFFGSQVTQITQTINTKTQFLNNLIDFENGRSFSVVGKVERDASLKTRLNFQFEKAVITVPPIPAITLPPVGRGYFDTVFVNEKYRLSKDVRGDYLISQRVG